MSRRASRFTRSKVPISSRPSRADWAAATFDLTSKELARAKDLNGRNGVRERSWNRQPRISRLPKAH